MNRGFVGLQPLGRIVAERGALDEIAVVEQQRIGRLYSGGGDQRGGLGESDRLIRAVSIIVVRVYVGVEVAGADQSQRNPGRHETLTRVFLMAPPSESPSAIPSRNRRASAAGAGGRDSPADGRRRLPPGLRRVRPGVPSACGSACFVRARLGRFLLEFRQRLGRSRQSL